MTWRNCNAPREGSRLARPRLRLRNEVLPLHQRDNRALLDRRRLLETKREDRPEQLLTETHGLKGRDRLNTRLKLLNPRQQSPLIIEPL